MINTIAISGNLAQDPEVRLGKNLNESYVTFSLCIHFYNGEEAVYLTGICKNAQLSCR